MATYPDEKFQEIYDSILASMGDDDTLKANLEAALKPMYDQSVQQLQQQRIANNAAIDVDAASRGMGNSTWVTDAKLRQLRGESDQLASLNANYNNQLYTSLLNAIQDRDDKAYSQAMQWYQLKNSGGGGRRVTDTGYFDGTRWWDSRDAYLDWIRGKAKIRQEIDAAKPGSKPQTPQQSPSHTPFRVTEAIM